jgi:hypothetical protein
MIDFRAVNSISCGDLLLGIVDPRFLVIFTPLLAVSFSVRWGPQLPNVTLLNEAAVARAQAIIPEASYQGSVKRSLFDAYRLEVEDPLLGIVGRICEYPWVKAPFLPIRTHKNQPVLHCVEKLVVEQNAPLFLKYFTGTVSI